jgi:hypothetical protein
MVELAADTFATAARHRSQNMVSLGVRKERLAQEIESRDVAVKKERRPRARDQRE